MADIPGRPIVSNNHIPTEKLSKFVDHHLKRIPATLPSHVQDTLHFLRAISDLNSTNTFDSNAILTTVDVTLLYANIPQCDGIDLLRDTVADSNVSGPMEVFPTLIDLIFKLNYFEFWLFSTDRQHKYRHTGSPHVCQHIHEYPWEQSFK